MYVIIAKPQKCKDFLTTQKKTFIAFAMDLVLLREKNLILNVRNGSVEIMYIRYRFVINVMVMAFETRNHGFKFSDLFHLLYLKN